jgi:hypothetical protein
MFNLITDEQFATAALNVVFPNTISVALLVEEPVGDFLRKYVLLQYFPEKFSANQEVNIYYNKYYWYRKFYQAYKNTHGNDDAMEQLEFKILEEGEYYDELDWSIVEELAKGFE